MDMARRTRTSLKGGLSWLKVRPNGARTVVFSCTTAVGLVFSTVVHIGQALQPQQIALPGTEGRQARRRIGGREDAVLVDVRIPFVKVVRVARQHHFDLALIFFQDKRPGTDHALFEIAVLFQHLAWEDHRHGFRHILREHRIGRL